MTGPVGDNPCGGQSANSAACPAPATALGGGVYSSSGIVLVDIDSTAPNGIGGWGAYENCASGLDKSITAFVVCAA